MLKQILKRLIRKPKLAKLSTTGRMAVRSRFDDLKAKIPNAKTIVDAGAAYGEMTQTFLNLYPEATVHAIEPNPSFFKKLQERFGSNPRVVLHPVALGSSEKTITFNVTNNQVSSSILLPTKLNQDYHPVDLDISQKIEVSLLPLDSFISTPIDILKLDLQGYELEALKGSVNALKHIRAITTEIEFVPLYENQPLFGDIDVFLRQKGFHLLNLYELWTHDNGQLTAGDALYLKEDKSHLQV